MKWLLILCGMFLLSGCFQQTIQKSGEGEFWEGSFQAVQPSDSQESTEYTLIYMPDDAEEINDIQLETDRGPSVSQESITTS